MRPLLLLIFASLLLVGCAATTVVHRPPSQTLKGRKIFYVDHVRREESGICDIIVQELKARGFTASSGRMDKMPEKTDAVLSYYAVWYNGKNPDLFKLDIRIVDPITQLTVAKAKAYRPYNRRQDTRGVVDDCLQAIFTSQDDQPVEKRGLREDLQTVITTPNY